MKIMVFFFFCVKEKVTSIPKAQGNAETITIIAQSQSVISRYRQSAITRDLWGSKKYLLILSATLCLV